MSEQPKTVDTILALHEQLLGQHEEALSEHARVLQDIKEWQDKLSGQLSMWRWLAPLVTGVASSMVTALILRSILP